MIGNKMIFFILLTSLVKTCSQYIFYTIFCSSNEASMYGKSENSFESFNRNLNQKK